MTSKPDSNSLAQRLLRFFEENPDEELTHAMVVDKFGASMSNAGVVISTLCAVGELERVHIIRRREKGRAS